MAAKLPALLYASGMFAPRHLGKPLIDSLNRRAFSTALHEYPDRGRTPQSPLPPTLGRRTVDEYVTSVVAGARKLHEQGAQQVGLVGHSMGGLMVLAAAARLAHTPWFAGAAILGSAQPAGIANLAPASFAGFLPSVPEALLSRAFLPSQRQWVQMSAQRHSPAEQETFYKDLLHDSGTVLRQIILGRGATRVSFRSIDKPIQVIAGSIDRCMPPGLQQQIVKKVNHRRQEIIAHLMTIPDADHMDLIDGRHEAVAGAIEKFFS